MHKKWIVPVAIAAVVVCLAAGISVVLAYNGKHPVPNADSSMSQSAAQTKNMPSRSFVSPGCCNGTSST